MPTRFPEEPQEKAIFKLFSLGVVTARDEWVFDYDTGALKHKVAWLIDAYNADVKKLSTSSRSRVAASLLDTSIKWSRAVKRDLSNGIKYEFNANSCVESLYRPFTKRQLYFATTLNEVQYQLPAMFRDEANPTIAFLCVSSSNPLAAMAVEQVFDYCLLKMGNGGTQALSRWRYDEHGNRVDNITDWALKQFKDHYKSSVPPSPQPSPASGRGGKNKAPAITKEAIFHYVYAVLHDPVYREKYAQNLKREFPRIPFYADFWRWAEWGREMMELHIGYEAVAPWPLTRTDTPDEKARKNGAAPKAMLKADKAIGRIALDSETVLTGIPAETWNYKLGNRSALEWILDQYKEKTPKDPTIRAKFNTYRFADYKEKVIDLIARVTRVSVETQVIVEAMKGAPR